MHCGPGLILWRQGNKLCFLQIQACTSIEDLEKTLETHEQLLDLAGCLRPTNMESKDTLVEDLVKWLVVGRNNMALQRFVYCYTLLISN